MSHNFPEMGRCITIIDRLMKMYYDRGLSEYEIGWGQQFYIEYIFDHPGATAQEMAECIRVDKATLTKIVKKLVEIEYVEVVVDEKDKRVRHLFPTQKAIPAVKQVKKVNREFYELLCHGLSSQEARQAEEYLKKIMNNLVDWKK